MSHAKRVMAPVLATGLLLSAWSGTAAQDTDAPAECDYTDATPVTVQLQWVAQAQFAGYYAAKDLCYYAEQGINPTLVEADPTGTPPQVIGSDPNGPDFTLAWVPKVLELRDKGESDLVNIAQSFQRSGTTSLAWADSGITSVDDYAGKIVGVWPFGNEYEVTAAIKAAGIPDDGWTKADQFFTMEPFLKHEMDTAMAMTYSEYAQVLETENPDTGELYQPEDLVVINYNDVGTAMLQDAIWAREAWLAEEGNEDLATRFLAATFQGWQYCRDNPEECVEIVTNNGSILGLGHQRWMMNEVNKLIWPAEGGIGSIPQSTWDQTVQIALDAGIIKAAPDAAAARTDLADAARGMLSGDVTGDSFTPAEIEITPGGN
jgi:NitT/TauT family transport system substrate-binding protein